MVKKRKKDENLLKRIKAQCILNKWTYLIVYLVDDYHMYFCLERCLKDLSLANILK